MTSLFQEYMSMEEVDKANEDAKSSGIMIAYFLPKKIAEAIAVENGEDVDELHLTILYLGKSDQFTKEQIESIKSTVKAFASTYAPLQGEIVGQGRFPATQSSDDYDVIINLVDVPRLEAFREALINVLSSIGVEPVLNHGYTPHITLAYVGTDYQGSSPLPKSFKFELSELTCTVGGKRFTYPLNGDGVIKFNPYHDSEGKFASSQGQGGGSYTSVRSLSNSVYQSDIFSSSEKTAISNYSTASIALNGELYDERNTNHHKSTVDALDSALKKSSLKQDTVLFRGLRNVPYEGRELLKKAQEGQMFQTLGFQSTSISDKSIGYFKSPGNVTLKIHASKGTPALVANEREKELLLPRNTIYRVRGAAYMESKGALKGSLVLDVEVLKQ